MNFPSAQFPGEWVHSLHQISELWGLDFPKNLLSVTLNAYILGFSIPLLGLYFINPTPPVSKDLH